MKSSPNRQLGAICAEQRPVLFLCAGSGVGGMERVVLTLSTELSRRQIPVRVILPDVPAAQQTAAWFAAEGAPPPEISPVLAHAFGHRRLSGVPALANLVRRSGAAVVNVHHCMNFPSLNDVLAVRLGGARCIASVHAGGGLDPPARRSRALKNRLAASLCSTVVAVSAFQAGCLIRNGVPPEKIRIIPNGASAPTERPDRTIARERLGLPADAFVISSVSRLTERKGTALLLQALGGMDRRQPPSFLAVAGDGPLRGQLEAMAREQIPDHHRFFGWLEAESLSLLYSASDLFVLASYDESFGLVYAEAALHEVPSIGTRVGGVSETVLHRRTGLLIPPGDVTALRGAMETLKSREGIRQQMARAARQRAEREFTTHRMADRYETLLLAPPSAAGQDHALPCAAADTSLSGTSPSAS